MQPSTHQSHQHQLDHDIRDLLSKQLFPFELYWEPCPPPILPLQQQPPEHDPRNASSVHQIQRLEDQARTLLQAASLMHRTFSTLVYAFSKSSPKLFNTSSLGESSDYSELLKSIYQLSSHSQALSVCLVSMAYYHDQLQRHSNNAQRQQHEPHPDYAQPHTYLPSFASSRPPVSSVVSSLSSNPSSTLYSPAMPFSTASRSSKHHFFYTLRDLSSLTRTLASTLHHTIQVYYLHIDKIESNVGGRHHDHLANYRDSDDNDQSSNASRKKQWKDLLDVRVRREIVLDLYHAHFEMGRAVENLSRNHKKGEEEHDLVKKNVNMHKHSKKDLNYKEEEDVKDMIQRFLCCSFDFFKLMDGLHLKEYVHDSESDAVYLEGKDETERADFEREKKRVLDDGKKIWETVNEAINVEEVDSRRDYIRLDEFHLMQLIEVSINLVRHYICKFNLFYY